MHLELSVLPKRPGQPVAGSVAELAKIMEASGLHYQLTSSGSILEGSWDQLMVVAKKCHDEVLKKTDSVTTIMRADDEVTAVGRPAGASDSAASRAAWEDDGDLAVL
jgi:uncharacterized protein YqgV (UPF0045/DUF77 family)